MPITIKKKVALFDGLCTVEEAELLLSWLLETKGAQINLRDLSHMHTSIVQVLMYFKPRVSVAPQSEQMLSLLDAIYASV